MSSQDSNKSTAPGQRPQWRPSTSRLAVIIASALVGLALMIGAAPLDGWWQSVLIELGASVLLLAPLAYIEDFLRRSLGELNATLRSSVVGLSAVRNLLPSGERRTAIFDELLTAVIDRARDGDFPTTQIGALLDGDSDDRTVALAAMTGNPSLVDGAAVLRSIRRPGSANEQYYALCAASAAWSTQLGTDQQARIIVAIDDDDHRRGWIKEDPHRQQIAARLRATPPSPASQNP
ncbi:hypothetical protein [Pseudonocardia sp. McavD-2-B]|uniref:hypothetical protein n=1 Tax=Pseudonocardia sp. McavD-2-B TaxID=2954499 RepID=UPI002096FDA8|nr:hypothetical protein [Pseudonocardia sp. McavD-2-B]MCO7192018.1 hypothetical protein [Pseudonocardia sp. McavD-2-B]